MSISTRDPQLGVLMHAANAAVWGAKDAHDALGDDGLKTVDKNQHGETALAVDIACEKAVIQAFDKTGLPLRVRSEEHGAFDLGQGEPRFLLMLDGLDVSGVYASSRRKGEYGTMFALFRGADPCYRDHVWSCVVQQALMRLTLSMPYGSYRMLMDRVDQDEVQRLATSGRRRLGTDTRIRVDEHFEVNRKSFSERLKPEHEVTYTRCSAKSYVDVAIGDAELALECTRKGNLEIATAYGRVTAAGGAFMDLGGADIGPNKVLSWGQDRQYPVIAAATPELARDLIGYLENRASEAL